jgi:hypothetical protein
LSTRGTVFSFTNKENEAKENFMLRWACLARNGGNLKSDMSIRLNAYMSPAGAEALVSLSCYGGL